MAFNLVELISSKKTEATPEVKAALECAVACHAPLELVEVEACGLRIRSGVFFNNICQDRVVFELDQYACPRGLRKGQKASCSFALHTKEDTWDYFKFETRITGVSQSFGRSSLQLAIPQQFTQQHQRNGQRLPLGNDDNSNLQIWLRSGPLPLQLTRLMDRPPLMQNGLRGNIRLRDISKGGMGLMLLDHGPAKVPQIEPGRELLLRLVFPHNYRSEPLHLILCARIMRCMQRNEGRKVGLQFIHLAELDQENNALVWQELEAEGVQRLSKLVRERCERLKAGPLR